MSYASLSVKDLTSLVSRSGTGSSSSPKLPGQTRPVKVIPLQHPDTSDDARPPSIPFDDILSGWRAKIKRMSLVDWVETLFPCFRWIRTYRWSEYFKLDLMAGITVGSFSRSAVSNESEAKTGLSGLITGIIIGCSLLFLTPVFKYIPQCALAAIVISAVSGLVDYDEAIFLWRVDKRDFTLWTITSTTTLFFGIEIGVLVGVGFSLAFVIHESANPHIAVLGRLPGTTVYRNVKQYPEAYTYNGIVIVRIDAPIYFANISYIKDRLRGYEVAVDKYTTKGPEVERISFVILEMSPVTHIDSSAVEALKELYQEYKARDIQLAISNPNKDVHMTIARSGMVELVGKEWYFVRVHDAVQVCLNCVQSSSLEDKKPSFLRRFSNNNGSSSYNDLQSYNTLLKEPLLPVEK
ncbi:hypothetical protein DY000_02000536 [Brassica cretica]|uniref:STAS domain-containing protein n=1 Tax=Brassica cretica TaxID=69181 RepID=A0ABQ7CDC5_BRACR|nr:hypothetical protein DY000_02000536 [Brassica cretica]